MDSTKDITVLSLCTGYGGLELGFAAATGRPLRVVAVEIEAYAQVLLVAQAEQGNLAIEAVYENLKTFPAKRFSGCFDFLIAGYPCQPFSVAGKQAGEDNPRHLWPFVCDIAEQVKPEFIFCENVAGHLRLGFDTVVRDLDRIGYDVEAGIFAASEVGAPHRRERLFILAHARSSRIRCISGEIDWRIGEQILRQRDREECSVRSNSTSESDELADSEHKRCNRHGGSQIKDGRKTDATSCCGETMADSESKRIQGNGSKRQQESEVHAGQTVSMCIGRGIRWPTRPGQEQYEWEEPRTLVRRRLRKSNSQSESGMGCTVDGFNSRVDQLRLLGNGCVPQQVEFAFRYLMNKMFGSGGEKKLIQKKFF